jgi:hypothetical protein
MVNDATKIGVSLEQPANSPVLIKGELDAADLRESWVHEPSDLGVPHCPAVHGYAWPARSAWWHSRPGGNTLVRTTAAASSMTEVEIDRFNLEDNDGNVYTVVNMMMLLPNDSISGDNSPIKGRTRLVLLGRSASVRRIDESTFEVVDTKQILRKV